MNTLFLAILSLGIGTTLFAIARILFSMVKSSPKEPPQAKPYPQSQQQADKIVHKAIQSAKKIMVKAELEGIKEIAKDRMEIGKLEDNFEAELASLMATILNKLEAVSDQTTVKQQEMLAKMEKSMLAYLARGQRLLDNRLTLFFEQLTLNMQSASDAAKIKLERHIDDEIAKAKNQIEDYKNARFNIVDEQFSALVEDAIRLLLQKKLSVSDHIDLIYQGLVEAKKENVI